MTRRNIIDGMPAIRWVKNQYHLVLFSFYSTFQVCK